ncbi:putative peptidoglycan lipid II flippase [Clostridium pascui]|nr:putative peptidoglycan lipid II flippase [Clostridium pascui]
MKESKFIKSSLIVMMFTIIGKVLAVIRDSLVAAKFGASDISDIYNFSIGIVYLLTTISYGLTTTFIPMNTEYIEKKEETPRIKFVNNTINIYGVFTILLILALIIFTKYIVLVFAPGFKENQYVFNTTVNIVRIMLLSLLFISIQSVITGVLQSHNEFYEPAAMSLVSNIVFIIYLVFLTSKYGIYGFAWATVISFLVQLIINLPKYKALGYTYKWTFNIKDKKLISMFMLMTPVIISTSLIQLNNFINRAFATKLFVGAATVLDYSNKINTLAYEVFAIGIAMVIYPFLSRYAVNGVTKEYKEILSKGINMILLIMVPASIAIAALRVPLITLIFKRGAFDQDAVNLTANALLFYSPAMIAYGLRDILNKAFYAVKDTKTPMINSFVGIIINVVINIFIVNYMKVSGLALATSISSIIITLLMLINLNKKMNGIELKNIYVTFIKTLVSAAIMGIIINIVSIYCVNTFGNNAYGSLISLLVNFVIGLTIYFVCIYFLKVEEIYYFFNLLKNKKINKEEFCMQNNLIEINEQNHIRNKKGQFAIKRFMDIVLSLCGIIVLSPIYLILILLIKLDSKGPAVFKQVRVGKDNKDFTIYKFRTMIVNAEKKRSLEINPEDIGNFVFQSKEDNRITKMGSFLRKTSLDELPQLFNVFKGDMSLVGPRPEIPDVVKYYPPEYSQRLLVLPGITGLAQVSGRGEIELAKTIYYDLTYIKNFSIWLDIKILFKTVFSVFKKEGAF